MHGLRIGMPQFMKPKAFNMKDQREMKARQELRNQAIIYYTGLLLDKKIDAMPDDPLQAYLDMLTDTAIEHEAETLSREIG